MAYSPVRVTQHFYCIQLLHDREHNYPTFLYDRHTSETDIWVTGRQVRCATGVPLSPYTTLPQSWRASSYCSRLCQVV